MRLWPFQHPVRIYHLPLTIILRADPEPQTSGEPLKVREAAAPEAEPAVVVNVRAARDRLSRLLDQAAGGSEVIITSDGRPKAKLVPMHSARPSFKMDWDLLASMPVRKKTPSAEELVREDRDERD